MLFVVPGPDAPISGGNRYNGALLEALGVQRIDADELVPFALEDWSGALWVDSLYLAQLPRIRARARCARSLGLLAHSLPSQLAQAAGHADGRLVQRERALLALLDRAVAPSETMRGWLAERAPSLPVRVVPPAHEALPANRSEAALTGVLVANLLPNKGVLPFLQVLTASLRPDDALTLRVIGRLDLDRAYAAQCLAYAEPRIVFCGELPFAQLLAEYARAHVLVSASRAESYGMAIAEGRASGCIVLAHAGGHVVHLHDAASGSLVDDDQALADALVGLVRDRKERTRRSLRAEAARPAARSWGEVAREFSRF